ncbi:hypothetical protein CRENPOLYSF2_4340005 [Crenothrix polyspora]|uniref:Uncharacterized protein n=1 Tax=Crenothrix polyspora TaxID=360316 RepID=A0A1R4HF90_9GAMM|nr:hypothetical protein CRENPOLYSF2_4340005 [Crenothrix polyspora]
MEYKPGFVLLKTNQPRLKVLYVSIQPVSSFHGYNDYQT